MLNPWRLNMLRELAIRGTITEVAKALYVTSSAVSQQLSLLEREVGIPLLEHQGRRVALTPAANSLVANAARILDAIEVAEIEMAQLRDTVAGHVRVSAFPSVAAALIPGVMTALRDAHPQLRVSLTDLEPHESITALRLGEVDIAVIDEFDLSTVEPDDNVERTLLGTDTLCCALPAVHPLAQLSEVRIEDLANEQWSMIDPSTYYFRLVVDSCRRASVQPDIVAYCRDAYVQLALAQAGACVAILPSLAFNGTSTGIVMRPVVPAIKRRIYVVVKPGRSAHPGIAAVVAQLVTTAARELDVVGS